MRPGYQPLPTGEAAPIQVPNQPSCVQRPDAGATGSAVTALEVLIRARAALVTCSYDTAEDLEKPERRSVLAVRITECTTVLRTMGWGMADQDNASASVAGDEVRRQGRYLTEQESADMAAIKDMSQALLNKIAALGTSRELSIARTKTEEAVMWAVKHITA